MHSYTKEIIVAYFQGGNAKDKQDAQIRAEIKAIIDIIEEQIGREFK